MSTDLAIAASLVIALLAALIGIAIHGDNKGQSDYTREGSQRGWAEGDGLFSRWARGEKKKDSQE
ncbi:MAG: hypothetical protein Q7S84_03240 [bacterium]|nr:hypothetical protein [bacterium]